MNEITYLFGAGASCQSMPIVKDFERRFELYIRFLTIHINHQSNFIADNQEFISKIKAHLSFDTFFKKLFHLNSTEEIKRYKKLLACYFMFEHFCPLNSYNDSLNFSEIQYRKSFQYDPRYDSLIAGLLKPISGLREFFTKVNFITWNYDLNLLSAIRNFMFSGMTLKNFINRFQTEKHIFSVSSEVTVVHLNGFMNSQYFDDFKNYELSDLIHLLNTLIKDYVYTTVDDSKNLSFAWENYNNSNNYPNFINSAVKTLQNSNSFIITGYSFPLYNRLFDQLIITNGHMNRKNIFIRDPRAEEIKEILLSDFYIPQRGKEQAIINTSTNCDSFFVPNQIFNTKG